MNDFIHISIYLFLSVILYRSSIINCKIIYVLCFYVAWWWNIKSKPVVGILKNLHYILLVLDFGLFIVIHRTLILHLTLNFSCLLSCALNTVYCVDVKSWLSKVKLIKRSLQFLDGVDFPSWDERPHVLHVDMIPGCYFF